MPESVQRMFLPSLGLDYHYVRHKRFFFSRKKSFIFLHGGGDPPEDYLSAIRLISRKFDVYAPDLRPFNHLETQEQFAELLLEFMQELELKKAHIFGQSLTGGIALVFAARYPYRVDKLVLASSVGIPLSILEYLSMWFRVKKEAKDHLAIQKSTPLEILKKLIAFLLDVFRKWDKFGWIYRLGKRRDLVQYMDKITAPTLIIQAKDDHVVPAKSAKKMNELIRTSELIYVQGGHGYIIGDANIWVPLMLKWLNT